jgi:photosystem II stability/assembly factor-like uncharacterized protein
MLGVALATAVLGTVVLFTTGTKPATAATVQSLITSRGTPPWAQRGLQGTTVLKGQVPLSVTTSAARYVGPTSSSSVIRLNFTLPLRDRATLDKLIAVEAKTHQTVSRAQLYARFAPPMTQVHALQRWLISNGFTITHTGGEHLSVGAKAPVATVEKALNVTINNYTHSKTTYSTLKVPAFGFFANTKAPTVPARLGLQSISGLSNVDRFYTSAQLATHNLTVRSGGYFGQDLRGLYDITGHGYDATGQTVGFTLWTAAERQVAMTAYATASGDTPITVDANCTATGNSPTTPSSCSTQSVAPDHLMTILENGNADNNWGSNEETGLDIEAAHGTANHVALKYYASECATNPPANTGLANAGCNGSDVGMEMAMEDAASDPTLHSVSNSWGYGGDVEWGATDPFEVATNNILALAAAAGTTFYFSTGDAGTYQSGMPPDSPYVVSVGGTSTYSTSTPSTWSTSLAWSGGGSWCSNIIARPSWQTGPGVTANASCPGRVTPDISTIADPNTGINTYWTSSATGSSHTQVGGTSLAAPVANGLQAMSQAYVNAQTYPGATPKIPFVAPLLYQMGNSANYTSYFRDIQCGNTANPTSGPDGDASIAGWDAATGWGEPDWFNYAKGIAIQLGATNVAQPASLSTNFAWTCAKTPSNSTERAFAFPNSTTGYAVGVAGGTTPWYGKFLASGAWGAVNTFFKTTDGGKSWFPSNSDMFSIACTSTSTCLEVGAGGRERMTTDSGTTWTDTATAAGNNKPLTQVTCPSSSICYAIGDRGNAMKSTDGGQTWSWLQSTDGNPAYGLSCPDTNTCYMTDIYAHVIKTSDGGATWAFQTTPITTPYAPVVAETGGPNPWGGMTGISCSDDNTCVGVGLYATVSGQTNPNTDPPIVTTTDGGNTWTRQVSGTGTGNFLAAVSCLPGTTTCTAVGRAGKIVTTTDLTTWTAATSNTTNMLNAVTCLSTTFCMAVGQAGTVDVWNGTTWTATTGNGGAGMLAGVSCLDSSNCYATGKQGITIGTTNGGTSWTIQAGSNGTTAQMNGVSCSSASACVAAGATLGNATTLSAASIVGATNVKVASVTGYFVGGYMTVDTGANAETVQVTTVGTTGAGGTGITFTPALTLAHLSGAAVAGNAQTLRTTNGGQTWLLSPVGTGNALNGVSCQSGTCFGVGAAGTIRVSADNGATWAGQTSNTTNALNWISCASATNCVAVGASGTVRYTTDGSTWNTGTSGTTQALNAVTCATALNCTAVGAAGTIIKSSDGGATWATQTSGTTNALSGVGCTDATHCVADGASGTTLNTDTGGATWTRLGNPTSGPTTALNATAVTLNGAACTSSRCFIGTGASGDIMYTQLLTVTVNTTSVYGTTPGTTGLAPGNGAIAYSPSGEAANVVGTLNCSTTATNASDVGTYPISSCSGLADPAYTVDYDYSSSSHTITKANQTITVGTPAPASATYGTGFTVSASAPAGAVTYGSSGGCSNIGGNYTMTSGTTDCNVTIDQGGSGNYFAATQVIETVNAQKATQTIDVGTPAPASATYATGFTVAATGGGSGNAIVYGSSGGCSNTGADYTMTSGSTDCTVSYDQSGDSNYSAATQVTETVNAQKAAQVILIGTHAPASATYGTGFTVSATGGGSGNAVTYGSSGGCSNTGADFTMTSGSTVCTVSYDQAGDSNYAAAPERNETVSADKASQTIHVGTAAPASAVYGTSFNVSATGGGSGNSITYGSSGGCSNSGGHYTMTSGTTACSVTYDQAGDSNYSAAPQQSNSVTAVKANQTIHIGTASPAKAIFGTSFTVAATSSSGIAIAYGSSGACSNSGGTYTITGAGTCTVTYQQAGDSNYNAAPSLTATVSVPSKTLKQYQLVCNGTYSGTAAEVTVPAGATCGLLPGTRVTNVLVVKAGGTLHVVGVKIGGTLSISGTGTVCGSKIGLDLKASNGSLEFGGPGCDGNTVGGNASVTNDTHAVWIWNNKIAGGLTVSKATGSTSIVDNRIFSNLLVTQSGPPVDVRGNQAHSAKCTGNHGQTGSGNTVTSVGGNTCPK